MVSVCGIVLGMLDLSTSACADFNEHTPNRADTHYRSYSGYRPFDAWSVWYLPGKLIEAREGYNDGLVSVQSAKWGKHVGTVPLDHLQQVTAHDTVPHNYCQCHLSLMAV